LEEANDNIDINDEEITLDQLPPYSPELDTKSGTSLALVADLAGVAPSSVNSAIISNPEIPSQTYEATGAEITSGFTGDPNAADTRPCYALFAIRGSVSDPGDAGFDFVRPMAEPGDYNPLIRGADGQDLDVKLNVAGAILDVGTPTASPSTVAAGTPVQFTASSSVLKNNASDPGPFTYSWDFGDGSAPGSGPSPTYKYPKAGTWRAEVTVTDAAGNQGISPPVTITVRAKSTTTTPTTPTTPKTSTTPTTGSSTPGGGGPGGGGGGGSPVGTGKSPGAPSGHKSSGSGTGPKKAQSSGALHGVPAVVVGSGSGQSESGSGSAGRGPAGYSDGVHGGAGQRAKGATVGGPVPTGRGKTGYLLNGSTPVPLTVNKSLRLQAVARASGGSGGSVGPLGWILGVLALVIVFSAGALRALEPRAQYRKLAAS